MNYILFDGPVRNALLPFTFTRPVADILIGIMTIRQKWEARLGSTITTITEDYLSVKFPMVEMEENVMRQHIELYVNDYSLSLGENGRKAVSTLLEVYERNNQPAQV